MPPEDLSDLEILVVDDEPGNVDVLDRLLRRAGYRNVRTTTEPRDVIGLFREHQLDLLLLDLRMPEMDGFDILALLQDEIASDQYFPVLVLTGDLAPEVKERALLSGARDFLTKPFHATEVLLRVRNLLETRALHLKLQSQNATLEDRVRERTDELARAQVEILHRLALAAEYRDDITGHHAERVGVLSALLAGELGLPVEEVKLLRRAATLHDVGKIGVPDRVLLKPGPLTPQEFDLMKSHTEIGARILSGSGFPLLQMAQTVARTHHERWDGSGYCGGSAGEDIPLVGRIVTVADVYDSLTHERPYKRASTAKDAADFVREGRGSHFDPAVVDAFMSLQRTGELERVKERTGAELVEETGADGLPPVSRREDGVLLRNPSSTSAAGNGDATELTEPPTPPSSPSH